MRGMKSMVLVAATLMAALPGSGAWAQEGPPAEEEPPRGRPGAPEGDWVFRLGAAGSYGPEYEGSDEYEFQALPLVEVEYKERFFLSPVRGAGVFLFNDRTFQLGVAVGYAFGRDEDDSSDLDGLGDIDGGAVVNVNAEYNLFEQEILPGLSFGAQFEHQFTGDDVGFTFGGDIGYRFPISRRLFLRPSVNAVYASGENMDAFFGVSAAQSASSGLAEFDPDSGIKSVGASLGTFYQFTENWGGQALLAYERLVGDAADSPIVKDEDQYRAFLGLVYRF